MVQRQEVGANLLTWETVSLSTRSKWLMQITSFKGFLPLVFREQRIRILNAVRFLFLVSCPQNV